MAKVREELFGQLEDFINAYIVEHGFSPTFMEIEKATGICHATAHRYVQRMKNKGEIDYEGKAHAIITKKTKNFQNFVMVPILGAITCGPLNFAEENIEEYIPLPTTLLDSSNEYFILRANGESMIDAGIKDGDMVVLEKTNVVKDGDAVAVLSEGQTTLKRIHIEKDRIVLHPENEKMEDIIVKECQVQGRAIYSINKIERR